MVKTLFMDNKANIPFPERKKQPNQYIKTDCPDCSVGDRFEILETLKKADSEKRMGGLYKCKCTLCGFHMTIQSKTHSPKAKSPLREKRDDYD